MKDALKNRFIKGKFYKTRDTKGGHYAKLYRKNTRKNKYWIVHFTDRDRRHRIKLLHQIDPELEGKSDSYVYTQPAIIRYERFHDPYPRDNLRVHNDDRKIVKKIQKKKMMRSTSLLKRLRANQSSSAIIRTNNNKLVNNLLMNNDIILCGLKRRKIHA